MHAVVTLKFTLFCLHGQSKTYLYVSPPLEFGLTT